MAERGTIDEQTESFQQHAAAETQSKMFDYIAGKTTGPLAAAEAELEHTAGYLGVEIEENAKLRAENERLRAALKPFSDMAGELFARNWNAGDIAMSLDNPNDPHRLTAQDFFVARVALVNEQKPSHKKTASAISDRR